MSNLREQFRDLIALFLFFISSKCLFFHHNMHKTISTYNYNYNNYPEEKLELVTKKKKTEQTTQMTKQTATFADKNKSFFIFHFEKNNFKI